MTAELRQEVEDLKKEVEYLKSQLAAETEHRLSAVESTRRAEANLKCWQALHVFVLGALSGVESAADAKTANLEVRRRLSVARAIAQYLSSLGRTEQEPHC